MVVSLLLAGGHSLTKRDVSLARSWYFFGGRSRFRSSLVVLPHACSHCMHRCRLVCASLLA
ncbi:hypothetical protein XCR_0996 [Xanthomonas campestris pv. raphani 756C]|nr:hypothetical protein XCR_0996 [Xanthomonas campestris pv. raphani 756C]